MNIFINFVLIVPMVVTTEYTLEHNPKIVSTINGKVEGHIMYSRSNKSFYAFEGIPFAKAPIKDLRFKAPVPPDPWEGILKAKHHGPKCIQKNYLFSEHPIVEGVEDCLYINVYTPYLPNIDGFYRLPVMVCIHFGAFLAGTGNRDYLGPEYFMDKNVILVTFNYRLGVFGLLSTGNDASPGNWAFKDQVAALKWVNKNIVAFGGNNRMVTIFGESAGAGSVHYHLLSPTTKNLFHKAISQSGSVLSLWARPNNTIQASVAKLQATFVGCDPDSSSERMIDCLRNIDATVLANSADMFKYFSSEPLAVYGPVIEKQTALNPFPYITEDPLDIIKKGSFQKVPWIIGVTEDEGILRAAPLIRNTKTLNELNDNFDKYGPEIFALPLSVAPEEVQVLWRNMTNFFLPSNFINPNNPTSIQGFINMMSDRGFKYGSYQSALLHAWSGHSTVWFYNFNYRGEYTYGDHFAGTSNEIDFNWGVCHSDDLLYLFPSSKLFRPLKASNDILMSQIMIQMWTDFAIKGDPSPRYHLFRLKWNPIPNLKGKPTVNNKDLIYLNIKGSSRKRPIHFQIRNDFLYSRMRFWESLPLAENINGIE